jgi:glycosyltransferase involved in cell wall biosynthesis
MTHVPVVSVGLPVYNGERFLASAIESILGQSFADLELIVSDNGSSDGTAEICERYARQDARLRYYRCAVNIGAGPNHNRVFRLARGKYFKWSAHDDENRPEFLASCIDVLDHSPESVVLACPQAELIDESGSVLRLYSTSIACASEKPHVRLTAMLQNIDLGTPMYGVGRRKALEQTKLHGSFIGADYVFLAELAMLGTVHEVGTPLLRKRIHAGRSMEAFSNSADLLKWYDPRNARRKHFLGTTDRLALEYLRSIVRLPLSQGEKIACAQVVLRHTQQDRAARWKRRLLNPLRLLRLT